MFSFVTDVNKKCTIWNQFCTFQFQILNFRTMAETIDPTTGFDDIEDFIKTFLKMKQVETTEQVCHGSTDTS